MYIQFDDSAGGAAQGIIPVQDAHGNMLGGASSSTEQHSRSETMRNMKNGANMLEERFEKMMEVVERNSEQISALSEAKEHRNKAIATTGEDGANGKVDTHGTSELSSHLDRISQMLEQNCAHVASLTERQVENEQKMREMIETQNARQSSEQPDMSQLTTHLDRIQKLMERNVVHERKDSARDIRTSPPRIDLSPLTFWLEKVLSAVEQNSEFVRELLQGGEDPKRAIPAQQIEIDLSPLSQRLDDLLDAQEAKATRDQDAHTQMNNRLDKIIEAQHKAVERGPFDVSLLSQRLDEILSVHRNAATASLAEKIDQIVEVVKEPMDFSELSQPLENLSAETARLREHLDLSPLKEPLEAIRTATEQNSEHLLGILESQQEPEPEEGEEGEDIEEQETEEQQSHSHDLEPLIEHLEALRSATEQNSMTVTEHLEALRSTTEQNSIMMTDLLESLAVNRQTQPESNSRALTPFDDNVNTTPERRQEGGMGGTKFLLSALSSHLSQIQAVTEANANAVRSTRESSHALQRSMTTAVSDTSNNIRALAAKHKDLAAQVGVREGQVREVVRTQSEMVECVRDLAKAFKTQEKAKCNHVVVPPPRKTGRKVVGFVYDAKDSKA